MMLHIQPCCLGDLADELLALVLGFLSEVEPVHLLRLRGVDRRWRELLGRRDVLEAFGPSEDKKVFFRDVPSPNAYAWARLFGPFVRRLEFEEHRGDLSIHPLTAHPVTFADIARLLQLMPALESLRIIDFCMHIFQDCSLGPSLPPLPRLRRLSLRSCYSLPKHDAVAFLRACPSLAEVDLWGSQVQEGGVRPSRIPMPRPPEVLGIRGICGLVAACSPLRRLNLGGGEELNGSRELIAAFRAQPALEALTLANVDSFNDDVLRAMLALLPGLRRFELVYSVHGCDRATLLQFVRAMPTLDTLLVVRGAEHEDAEDFPRALHAHTAEVGLIREILRARGGDLVEN